MVDPVDRSQWTQLLATVLFVLDNADEVAATIRRQCEDFARLIRDEANAVGR